MKFKNTKQNISLSEKEANNQPMNINFSLDKRADVYNRKIKDIINFGLPVPNSISDMSFIGLNDGKDWSDIYYLDTLIAYYHFPSNKFIYSNGKKYYDEVYRNTIKNIARELEDEGIIVIPKSDDEFYRLTKYTYNYELPSKYIKNNKISMSESGNKGQIEELHIKGDLSSYITVVINPETGEFDSCSYKENEIVSLSVGDMFFRDKAENIETWADDNGLISYTNAIDLSFEFEDNVFFIINNLRINGRRWIKS
jgi:hypothetical protein